MTEATRILLIRHAETDWNRAARLQGHTDIPLNAHGLDQAGRLGAALAGERLDAVYSSDLQRALQTARAVADATGAPLVPEPGLRERGFGVFEGLSQAELEARWPAELRRWRAREPGFAVPGGETLAEFYARCVAAAERRALAHAGGSIALVAHGGVLDCLYRAATRLALDAPRSWRLANAALNRLLHSPEGFALVGWDDDAHLAPPP
jgi:2,3-bisphosphoglycerate-dependent phosphoglycerate mutase